MSYRLNITEKATKGKAKFTNEKGDTECVEFIRQATDAPQTRLWKMGKKIGDSSPGEIIRGTAIATFDDAGNYPTDAMGKHAAIYLSHSADNILVLDQWNRQGEVKQRPIWFKRPKGTRRSDDADTFYVIE